MLTLTKSKCPELDRNIAIDGHRADGVCCVLSNDLLQSAIFCNKPEIFLHTHRQWKG